MKRVRIQTGGLFVSAEPAAIHTVLGSCISACIFDPVAAVGGMNHFMLPGQDGGSFSASAKYGNYAMDFLIGRIVAIGGQRGRLRAKVFGASHVLRMEGRAIQVPDANARFVREYLALADIPIVGHQLCGHRPLDVTFHSHTGAARVRAFGWGGRDDPYRQELAYAESLRDQPPKSVITMF